jgi:cytochrome c2
MKRSGLSLSGLKSVGFVLIVLAGLSDLEAADAANSSRGGRLLETLSCLECHRMNGKGGASASDLGWWVGRNLMPASVAAMMWNHAPEMWAAMRERSIVPAEIDDHAADDLFAYFYTIRFFERTGDAERGRAAFESKGCSTCHGIRSPKLPATRPASEWESISDPIALASAMWNHNAAATGEGGKQRVRPQLTSRELTDLVIYLQGQVKVPRVFGSVPLGSGPKGGETLLRARGCNACHTEVALAEGLKGKTLTDVAAVMWNHQSPTASVAPRLTVAEMREIAGYLWAPGFFENSGDAAAGRRVFSDQHCDTCHIAPRNGLTENRGRRSSAITMVSALWRHDPKVLEEMKARGIAWPRFEGSQMSDLIAFLNSDDRGTR